MGDYDNILQLTTVPDALKLLCASVRLARQRLKMTQEELSARAGVPMSTISRLERTGLGSTDMLFKVLFALDELTSVADFLKERKRLNELPTSLSELPREVRVIRRVRHRKNPAGTGK